MPQYAYFQKQFMPLAEAKLGLMTNFMHYGTGVFEGIRGNWNAGQQQLYIFRLKEHYERFINGCKVLKIQLPYSLEELSRLTVELVARSYPHVRVRVNMNPGIVACPDPERIYHEIDRVLAFAGDRPNCLLGTGALPLETPPENIRLIKDYLIRNK